MHACWLDRGAPTHARRAQRGRTLAGTSRATCGAPGIARTRPRGPKQHDLPTGASMMPSGGRGRNVAPLALSSQGMQGGAPAPPVAGACTGGRSKRRSTERPMTTDGTQHNGRGGSAGPGAAPARRPGAALARASHGDPECFESDTPWHMSTLASPMTTHGERRRPPKANAARSARCDTNWSLPWGAWWPTTRRCPCARGPRRHTKSCARPRGATCRTRWSIGGRTTPSRGCLRLATSANSSTQEPPGGDLLF